jgi:hypothetical protein
MVYVSGNIPSGAYDPNRLANPSFGFTAVDFRTGSTYLNPKTGHEFSVVGGMNEALQYRNGIDFHLDWAASQFISKTVHIGLAGYYFQQITGDSGTGATLGDFKGRVLGIDPQIGFILPIYFCAGVGRNRNLSISISAIEPAGSLGKRTVPGRGRLALRR